jgi:type I restriction enzyme S subunit
VKYGLSEPLKNTEAKSPIDLPIISIRNVNSDGQLALDELKYFPIPIPKRSSLLLRKGDLLFNWRNAPNLIGKTAIFNLEGDYVNASFLLRMRPPKADLDGRFTWLYANFLRLSGYFKMESNAAVNQSNFNASRTSGVVVPLPSLDEQRQIVESVMLQLSDIDRVQRCIEADLLRAARLRQSILKQAFEGKLVPQNPKDEPASGLLERIKAEPKTTSGNGKPTAAIRKRIKKETT